MNDDHGSLPPETYWEGAVVFFFLVTYFALAGFAIWYAFTHL